MKRVGSLIIVACFATLPLVGCGDDDGAVCANGVIEGREVCDLNDLGGESCATQGFTEGILACNTTCDGFNTSQCTTCGDGLAQGAEDCDTTDLGGNDCSSVGFTGGVLDCDASCNFDTTNCTADPVCGNDSIEGTEVCDGADLGGESCTTRGFDGGTLACNSTCSGFDTSACTGGTMTCVDVTTITPDFEPCDNMDQAGCVCEGCVDDGVCFDGNSDPPVTDDCVCPDCATDAFCTDPTNCDGDGLCNPYLEGCGCQDCQAHPSCQ